MTLLSLLLITSLVMGPPETHEVAEALPASAIGVCDPVDGAQHLWTPEAREETRRRVQRACKAAGASPLVCAYADAVVVRESDGRPSIRHTLGEGENGLGPMGLSLRWHADKWPGEDEDPMFCTPEASFVVAHAIMWRALTRYQATTILDVQAVYAGRWRCVDTAEGRSCFADPTRQTEKAICKRMQLRGFSCHQRVTRKDLGRKIPLAKRREFVEQLLEGGAS